MQKFRLGQVVDELVGLSSRRAVVVGYACYARAAAQYLIEDRDPLSQRGSRWVEEAGLRMPATADRATDEEGTTRSASWQDHERAQAAPADRSSRAVDRGGVSAAEIRANGDRRVEFAPTGGEEHVAALIGELKSFDPTAGFVEDLGRLAKREGVFVDMHIRIEPWDRDIADKVAAG